MKIEVEMVLRLKIVAFPYLRTMQNDELYMQRCIDLARLGEGDVAPNPMVGAVIVLDDKIIGEGFHEVYGEAHAEVNAINSVSDKSLISKATIYVSLEPCSHFGKTPPCSNLIIQSGFKRVVIGCQDSFSEVSGKGIQKLEKAGLEVTVNVLEKECRDLNKRFFTFHEKKRPYFILKWAQTKDGFIDKKRTNFEIGVNWISAPETKSLVHKWRSQEQSILVGKNTVLADNPSLTVREVAGNNPVRIVLDSKLEVSATAKIYNDEAPTIIFNVVENKMDRNIEWIQIEKMDVNSIVEALYQKNIQSVFIEGGSSVLQSFIESGCWDEARIIEGNSLFREGLKAPLLPSLPTHCFQFSTDLIYYYFNK